MIDAGKQADACQGQGQSRRRIYPEGRREAAQGVADEEKVAVLCTGNIAR